jgi:hypothetical protein
MHRSLCNKPTLVGGEGTREGQETEKITYEELCSPHLGSQSSSVTAGTKLQAGRPGFNSRQGQ